MLQRIIMKNYQNFRKVRIFTLAVIAMVSTNVSLNAAEAVTVSGAVRTAEIKAVNNQVIVTGRLSPTAYGSKAWPNHYHVSVVGAKGELLNRLVYRHGLKAPKAQSRQSSRPYRLILEGISVDSISEIRFERVTKSHGSCS